MAPHAGLVHLKEYDIKDSNVELIGSDLDHKVKHASAETEPAWNDGHVGRTPGLFVWRIDNFAVVPVPKPSHGVFYSGDSYIVLHSQQIKSKIEDDDPKNKKLTHAIHFLLGTHTSQDEASASFSSDYQTDISVRFKQTIRISNAIQSNRSDFEAFNLQIIRFPLIPRVNRYSASERPCPSR
jgi:gelsolin